MTVTDPRQLWRVQLALECKAFDGAGRLVQVPCADPDHLHACYAVRYSNGTTELAFAATAPDWFVQHIGRHNVDQIVTQSASVVSRLRADGHAIVTDHFHTYCFSGDITVAEHPTITSEGPETHSIMVDGQRVAGASSSRSDDNAAELWIETDPAHRRRGYATGAALAWAAEVRADGKIAFYSHLHENAESAAVAKRLRVEPLFEIVALDLK